MLYTINIIITN